jgi:hypothetical protein
MRRSTVAWLLALALGTNAACAGTSAGNPIAGKGGTQTGNGDLASTAGQCDAKPSTLASLTASTPLGFSAADVLAFASGSHETSIRWQPSDFAMFAPESGKHALHLKLTPKGNKPRYVKYSDRTSNDGGAGLLIDIAGPDCKSLDALEVDVTLEIKSDGGALDEKLDGTLRASATNWATLHVDLKADMLGGGFKLVSTKPAGFKLVQLAVDLGLSPLGLRGSLSGVLEMHTGNASTSAASGTSTGGVSTAGGGALALIGAEGCDDGGLPIALDHALRGFSGQDVLDLVNGLPKLDGVWKDGTKDPLRVSLEHRDGAVCALLAADDAWVTDTVPGTLRLHETLHMSGGDGRLDASWPVVVAGKPDAKGALSQVSIALDSALVAEPTADNLESVYGIHGVDATSYDGVQVSFSFDLMAGDSAPSASGKLDVAGLKLADCAKNPPAPMLTPDVTPNGSSASSPGCAGADLVPLESLSW